jgi:hypothetical protein
VLIVRHRHRRTILSDLLSAETLSAGAATEPPPDEEKKV